MEELKYDQFREVIKLLERSFKQLDSMSPTGEEDCSFEDALYQFSKVRDSISCIDRCLEEIVLETQFIRKALSLVGEWVSTKTENPYSQSDFVNFIVKKYKKETP